MKIEVKDYWYERRQSKVNDAEYMYKLALNLQRSIKQAKAYLGSDYSLWMTGMDMVTKRFKGRLDKATKDLEANS